MNESSLYFLSVPGLRVGDVDAVNTPTLYQWANGGAMSELVPSFPCVTSPVQATIMTGAPPTQHGVIANGFYHRARREVEFWVGHHHTIEGMPIFNRLVGLHPPATSAVWHAQNIKGAAADYIVTPAPIHEPDGTTKLWCYSKPDGLYARILESLGHFPLHHYWGPMANIESTRWILRGAAWLAEQHQPNFQWIYIPHLDYAAQKFGPNSAQAKQSLRELDTALAGFVQRVSAVPGGDKAIYLVAGEYALTDVEGPVHPNRILREAGLLEVRMEDGAEHLDFERSRAFAMVDHQFAHVYIQGAASEQARGAAAVKEAFRNVTGVAHVAAGEERAALGVDHPRSGEVVLVTDDRHWLTYYWWNDNRLAPKFARTVDIHRKPGYDPVELFFDPVMKGIPLDATLVKGSHGCPASEARHHTALLCSQVTKAIEPGRTYRDTEVMGIILGLIGQP